MRTKDVRPIAKFTVGGILSVASLLAFAPLAHAQSPTEPQPESEAQPAADATDGDAQRSRGAAAAAVENITITGTKKARGQIANEAPVALTAFGDEQLEAFQFRDLESLTFAIPNVSLDAVGTAKGVANFSIRGLGANSSIPTIDPTVGLFVNGVYFGTNAGAVLDAFDLEAVEVLRGPQGILFGRNVTGGAVLLRTKRPGDEVSASVKTNFEINGEDPSRGFEYRLYGGVDVPLVEDVLKARIAGQFRSDSGWFNNLAPNENFNPADPTNRDGLDEEQFGEEDTWLIRPTVTFTPTDNLTLHVMFEHGETDAQGPPSQSTNRIGRVGEQANPGFVGVFDGFDFSIDEPGFADYVWNQVFGELIWDLGSGGQIVDVFGYRNVDSSALSDIDSQPISLFHAGSITKVEHWSNELRYSNTFSIVDTTFGFYVFGQTIRYRENRLLFEDAPQFSPTTLPIDSTFGGDQDQLSLGAFTSLDINLTPELRLIVGGRYTWERKEADVVTFSGLATPNPPGPPFQPSGFPCAGPLSLDCPFDAEGAFNDSEIWQNFSPKLGAQWDFAKDNQVYGHWTRGFRSGGYNMRNTSADPTAVPGPFDEEQQDVFEVGLKSAVLNRKIRFGIAGFVTLMNDLQREVNIPGDAGVVQIIRNTADATIGGLEAEATIVFTPKFIVTGSFGYTDGQYRDVRFDLNGDGAVGDGPLGDDEDLQLPRLANVTANVGAIWDIDVGSAGYFTLRGNYAYRDSSFFTDNNFGLLPSGHVVDASLAFTISDIAAGSKYVAPRIAIYGRNLLNEAFLGGQTVLPFGGNFSPIKEGRVLGLEFRVDYN